MKLDLREAYCPGHFGNSYEAMWPGEMRDYLAGLHHWGFNRFGDWLDPADTINPYTAAAAWPAELAGFMWNLPMELLDRKKAALRAAAALGIATDFVVTPNRLRRPAAARPAGDQRAAPDRPAALPVEGRGAGADPRELRDSVPRLRRQRRPARFLDGVRVRLRRLRVRPVPAVDRDLGRADARGPRDRGARRDRVPGVQRGRPRRRRKALLAALASGKARTADEALREYAVRYFGAAPEDAAAWARWLAGWGDRAAVDLPAVRAALEPLAARATSGRRLEHLRSKIDLEELDRTIAAGGDWDADRFALVERFWAAQERLNRGVYGLGPVRYVVS